MSTTQKIRSGIGLRAPRNQFRNLSFGFTLIELLIVISIIALLLSIIVPTLSKAKQQANLILCANNQKQLLTGVMLYSADHQQFPPSIQGHNYGGTVSDPDHYFWTVPMRLNYHTLNVLPIGLEGGKMINVMGAYISDARLYSCPLARYKEDEMFRGVGGNMDTYQNLYLNGGSEYLDCSYFLLWNYHGFNNAASEKPFVGPGKHSKSTLLISDVMFYNDVSGGAPETWVTSHPYRGAEKSHIYYYLLDPSETKPNVTFNAGYSDGSVSRYKASDTVRECLQSATYLSIYIPMRFQ